MVKSYGDLIMLLKYMNVIQMLYLIGGGGEVAMFCREKKNPLFFSIHSTMSNLLCVILEKKRWLLLLPKIFVFLLLFYINYEFSEQIR